MRSIASTHGSRGFSATSMRSARARSVTALEPRPSARWVLANTIAFDGSSLLRTFATPSGGLVLHLAGLCQQPGSFGARPLVGLALLVAPEGSLLLVVAPRAGEHRRLVRERIQLDEAVDGSVEEGAVVGDRDDPPGEPADDRLEHVEAVQVEVVRRLVQQQDVEADDRQRGERRARALPTGQRRYAPVEVVGHAEAHARLLPRARSGRRRRARRPEPARRCSAGSRSRSSPIVRATASASASAAATPVRRAKSSPSVSSLHASGSCSR